MIPDASCTLPSLFGTVPGVFVEGEADQRCAAIADRCYDEAGFNCLGDRIFVVHRTGHLNLNALDRFIAQYSLWSRQE